MTRAQSVANPAGALATFRVHCSHGVAQASRRVGHAAERADAADRATGAASAEARELEHWAGVVGLAQPPTVRVHLLAHLIRSRSAERRAQADSETRRSELDAARGQLAVLRGREKAIERLTQKLSERRAVILARTAGHQQDELWQAGCARMYGEAP